MLKILCLTCIVLSVKSTSIGSLEFDSLDTDLADLKYEVEEEDLDDYSKLLDESSDSSKNQANAKKSSSNQGSSRKHNIGDQKKFYKGVKVDDKGLYDDGEEYAQAEGYAGTAVGVRENEDRKYRKGTKTRGFHHVHHQDEYKKDKEFYEDDETSGVIKKVGAKGLGYKLKAGAGFNKGHFHHNRQKGLVGAEGYSDKGFSDKAYRGYADSQDI